MAMQVFSHHIFGSCSAQPGCGEIMGISISGYCTEAIVARVTLSTTETFTEDVPKSIPRNNMF